MIELRLNQNGRTEDGKRYRNYIEFQHYYIGNMCLAPLDKVRLTKELAQFILEVRK